VASRQSHANRTSYTNHSPDLPQKARRVYPKNEIKAISNIDYLEKNATFYRKHASVKGIFKKHNCT
jgi:hypothetical protein